MSRDASKKAESMAAGGAAGVPSRLSLPYGTTRGREAFAAWSALVAPVGDVTTDEDAIESFRFGFDTWVLGPAILNRVRTGAQTFDRSIRTAACDGFDHVVVLTAVDGLLSGQADGRTLVCRPGDIGVFDLARPVAVTNTELEVIALIAPRALIAPLVTRYERLHGLILPAEAPRARLLASHMIELAKLMPEMRDEEVALLAEATVNLAAGCLGAASDAGAEANTTTDLARLHAVKSFIDERLGDPALEAELICKELGLSRAALYRLLEPLGGVATYIRRRRLGRCLRDLASPRARSDRVSEIAFRWGFTNEASFSRAFRAAFGLSPREARQTADLLMRRGEAEGRPRQDGSGLLASWLSDLMRL